MTGRTVLPVMASWLFALVAGFAICYRSTIYPIRMATCALNLCMQAHQWKEIMLAGKAAGWKWYSQRVNGGVEFTRLSRG